MHREAFAIQGTGTADEMALEERAVLALEGCVIADVAVVRPSRPSPQQQPAPASDASAAPEDQHEQEEVRCESAAQRGRPSAGHATQTVNARQPRCALMQIILPSSQIEPEVFHMALIR